jgi:uncharacterized protein (DUF2235 family)
MALYAFDGTGNEDRPGAERDSNVLHFFNAYVDPHKNADPDAALGSLYIEGIGVRAHTPIGDVLAKAFGLAAHNRLKEARRRLDRNIAAGDATVVVVGFSRGDALAVDFANQVCRHVPAANVRFLGVWDIVAQFGLPGEHVNLGFDLDCPDVVACHAMAIDENRAFFPLTRLARAGKVLAKLREVWFRGVHSDIGGGNGNIGLNWIALDWMFGNALRHGLPIDPAAVTANLAFKELPRAVRTHEVAVGPHRRFASGDAVHVSVELTDVERQRLLDDPRLAISIIDDAGTLSPLRAGRPAASA